MRRRRRADAKHWPIVAALLRASCTVVDTSMVGGGFPDLVVGRGRVTYLLEVKSPDRVKYRRASERNQAEWRATWRGGPVIEVQTETDALRAVGAIRMRAAQSPPTG